MTDNEIIKALECVCGNVLFCQDCPYSKTFSQPMRCKEMRAKDAIDLINRQKAEIERLKKLNDEGAECPTCHGMGKIGTTDWLTRGLSKEQIAKEKAEAVEEFHRQLKAEAIKEFADELCKGRVSNDPVVIGVNAELNFGKWKEKQS